MRLVSRLKHVGFALSLLTIASTASAQDKKDCEPGSWFCGESTDKKGDLQPLPETKPADKAGDKTPPPVVVYQPPPPTVVVQPRDAPPAYYYVPKKAVKRREWGLNLHLGGATYGGGRDGNAGMALAGLGLRYRFAPPVAVEADLDFGTGRDYNGYRRTETAFTVNGLVFLNPRSVTQVYLVGGFGWSGAKAIDDRDGIDKMEYHYGYFGVQGGLGLEFRLARSVALNIDVRGMVRGRIDDNKRSSPEFTSDDGKTSNTSGAALLRGGLTFYW